jgi:hypothetical protein
MNSKKLKLIVSFILLMIYSCDDPETVVTNIIHKDGSITRRVEMRRNNNNFRQSEIQIPIDTTWTIKDSCIISEKGDTSWIRTAEKHFADINELNNDYKNDSSCNRKAVRSASLKTNFRWFNTIYRFSEMIEKNLSNGYPVSGFLSDEELQWFYTPWNDQEAKRDGIDSVRYRVLSDSVNSRTNEWFFNSIVSEWVHDFSGQIYRKDSKVLPEDTLKIWEKRMLQILKTSEKDFDSLWKSGIALESSIGKVYAEKYRIEADSSLELVEEKIDFTFKQYSMRFSMPGKLIGSNGYADSSKVLLWSVNSDYFFTEDYEMWAESKVPNIWAWVVSGVFVVFVFTGLIIRKNKRG